MSQAANKIKTSIKTITHRDVEIMSGKVLSVDEIAHTVTVLVTNEETAIEDVMLSAIINNDNGVIVYPAINSDVVIGCVDGPGEYMLIKASTITKAVVKINDQVLTMDGTKYGLVKASESLGKLMQDLMTQLLAMTFTNGAGTTSPANNTSSLNDIKTRLNNFLTA